MASRVNFDDGTEMTKTNSTGTTTEKPKTPDKLDVVARPGMSDERQMAELILSPVAANTITSKKFSKGTFGEFDLTESVAVMKEKIRKVNAGDLSEVEATLTAQATTLDAIFNEMARRAAANMGEHLSATESYMRLAFKAQAQCRSTLETLADVKSPRHATFVRQQNIANQQQVNNGAGQSTHGKEISTGSTELLEADHGERLDTRATGAASGHDPRMETVGAIHRA